jgi:hypothetical protein
MPDLPSAKPTLAPTDSVTITIQPFIKESGDLVYHGNVAFLDPRNEEQYVELKATEPLFLINQINDALRNKNVSLRRVSGEIPPLPPQEEDSALEQESGYRIKKSTI